tara:strand:+ start:1503 stop:1943 length:441 start_codon:yes stop_codon:yes gene_type:complete
MITKKETLRECETFGDILKYYRTQKNITMTDLATEMEMFQENLCCIERGSRKPPPFNKLKNMACALDLNKHEKIEFYKLAFLDKLLPEQLEHYRVIQQNFRDLKKIEFDATEIDPNLAELAEIVSDISPRQYKTLVGMIRQFLSED